MLMKPFPTRVRISAAIDYYCNREDLLLMYEGCQKADSRRAIRLCLGLFLLVAAGLKAHSVLKGTLEGDGLFDSRLFSIGFVLFEVLFGLILLSGLFQHGTWLAATVLFSVFAAVSFYRGISGAESCGCFGQVHVNPWWTFVLDVVIVTALLRWRPSWRAEEEPAVSASGVRVRLATVGALFVLIGGPATYLMATSEPARMTVEGVIEGDGNLVILEPEKWVGQPLPIQAHIDLGDQLATGQWTLLLHRHDCPKCQEVIPQYEQAARALISNPGLDGMRIAFVEVPPYGHAPHSSNSAVCCRMSTERDWFVQTPVEIQIYDGKVTQVSTDLDHLHSSHGGGKLAGSGEYSSGLLDIDRRPDG